jgi:uncharacterized OsmC-like protein
MSDTDLTTYELTGTRISPKRMTVDTGDASFVVGKDVNPVEYFLGSILGCLNSTATMVARDMDLGIDALEVTIEGSVNYAAYRGEASTDRPGLQGVDVVLSVASDAEERELDSMLAAVEERCPVTDNVENETDIGVRLERL